MTVLILYTLPPESPEPGRTVDEFELSHTAANVSSVLPGAWVQGVRGEPLEILAALDHYHPDVVFNLCEAPRGRPDLEPHVASLLELTGVRFTGASSHTLALCRRKDILKPLFASRCIDVPRDINIAQPLFPCIVKPADEDGSAGLFHDSVCDNREMLDRALSRDSRKWMVEEFLPGREFVVSLWGRSEAECVSIGETVFQNDLRLITYEGKWDVESADFAHTPMRYDSDIAPPLRDAIVSIAKAAWTAVEARHYLRLDIRLDSGGKPHVLDVNPNPEMGPGVGICRAVQEAGWTWAQFVRKLVEWA